MTVSLIAASLYLGLLSAVSPCPLATNIAAVSFIGREVSRPSALFLGGVFYALGRIAAFCILGIFLARTWEAVPAIAHIFQKYMNIFLGPCMILAGMFLLELLSLPTGKGVDWSRKRSIYNGKRKLAGAFLLGIVFALSFCPTSVVLYFGTLLPLAVKAGSPFLLSGLFGLAGSLPVLLFAFVLAFAGRKLAQFYHLVEKMELFARRITGGLFLLIGIYFTLIAIL